MASSQILPLSTTISFSHSQLSSRQIFFGKPPRLSTRSAPTNGFKVSCNATNNGEEAPRGSKVDRRNLLLGMGDLYGATNLIIHDAPPSLAVPIKTVQKCSKPKHALLDIDCCPSRSDKIIDYKLPPVTKLHVRPAAHLAPDDYIAKYKSINSVLILLR